LAQEQLLVFIIDLLVDDCDAITRLLISDEKVLLLSSALPSALAKLFLLQIVLLLLVFKNTPLNVING